MPEQGSIQITYPTQIILLSGESTTCTVTVIDRNGDPQDLANKCEIDDTAKTIMIKDIYGGLAPYSHQISVKLDNIKNPPNNRPGNGFMIQTYADNSQTFQMDKLNDFILEPRFECEYPCQTC
jgi:hypothetical protein